ncbi:4-hydroxy-tetrahydrodipicolinate synthase [Paraburkholderia flava]|jgi:4-hydroxy-tetrahydrodipicolinate synthase|uniref:4-hydroxy-tetrahydrodipicolinate synthase n=1 Tax=Paraburkholderia flava TaxID=2547393 RepID=UPI00105B9DBC|nr:4-hydroxy-tetrahydrodipicolinate synthase [Paraburkholderia flava]
MYNGIWLPIVTPFRSGSVDIDALQMLTEHYLRSGISGIVALSTTGETALLSDTERATVLQAITDVARNRLPVIVGVAGYNTLNVTDEIRRFDHWDVAGFLVSAPSYVRPDQAGVQWHFEQVAQATARPIMLYNVPHRTGVSIDPETVNQLSRFDNIVAIKECDPKNFEALRNVPVSVLCGTDDAFGECLKHGGAGGILATAHICADLLLEANDLALQNRQAETDALLESIRPLLKLLFSAPNPAAIKAMLAMDFPVSAETRMPISPASTELIARLRDARDSLHELRGAMSAS